MQQTIERIDRLMAPMLNDEQASELHTVLVACLTEKGGNPRGPETMTECIDLFLAAKKLVQNGRCVTMRPHCPVLLRKSPGRLTTSPPTIFATISHDIRVMAA